MAKRSLPVGGTPGAIQVDSALAEYLSIQFHFDPADQAKILSLLPPSEKYLAEWARTVGDLLPSPDVTIVQNIESCANRFLRRKVRRVSKSDQRQYLDALVFHTSALMDMFNFSGPIEASIADPFPFMEKAGRSKGDKRSALNRRVETLSQLVTLNLFARFRLQQNLEPMADEEAAETVRRRNEYPRFVLIADLLAAFSRVTSREITAHATKDKMGQRHVSPAVDFLVTTVPPILKAAKVKAVFDDQTARNEISDVKRLWEKGLRPELEYMFVDWAHRKIDG